MLRQVAPGVLVSQSQFLQTNAIVVQGAAGVLLIDAGVLEDELVALADELQEFGQPVVAGFSTHPHWDHLLWHARLGRAPRYGTARCAATVHERLPDAEARARVVRMMPPGIVGKVPLELLGFITGLPIDATRLAWDGPEVRIIEHAAHAPGHAALLIPDAGVLVAGDMVSDVLVPMLDLGASADPIGSYAAALGLFEGVAPDVDLVIPGHGSIGDSGQLCARIAQDRAYLDGLRAGELVSDPRFDPSANAGHS